MGDDIAEAGAASRGKLVVENVGLPEAAAATAIGERDA